jgi:hypothetical protein
MIVEHLRERGMKIDTKMLWLATCVIATALCTTSTAAAGSAANTGPLDDPIREVKKAMVYRTRRTRAAHAQA